MSSCVLCLKNYRVKILLDAKINALMTIKDAIEQHFSFYDQLFAQSSSSQFVCRKCFSSLKDFYNFIDKINAKHILPLSHVKVEEEKDPENFEFTDFERPIDLKDLRVVIHRVKTEPEDVSNDNIEWKIEDENSNDKVETSRRYSNDSDFEWKLEEDSEFNIASSLQTELIEIPIPPQNHETELIEIPQETELVKIPLKQPTKKRKNSSDSEYSPYKGRLVTTRKQPTETASRSRKKEKKLKPPPQKSKTLLTDERIKNFTELKCHECDTPTESSRNHYNHFKEFHPGIPQYLMCCGIKFIRRNRLLEHITVKHDVPDPDKRIKCDFCTKTFKTISRQKSHHRNMHTNKKLETFVCPQCGKLFNFRAGFLIHLRSHDDDPNTSFECYVCKKPLKSLQNVKVHLYQAHRGKVEKVKCKICSKEFTKSYLEIHMKFRHSQRRYEKVQCPICDHWVRKEFISVHSERHKEPGETCPVCQKYLKNPATFKRHMKVVHSEKQFACEICGKRVARPGKLLEHMAVVHTKEFLYKCRVPGCGREFRAHGNWKMHEKHIHPVEYEKFFKPVYKRAPETVLNDEEILKALNEMT